MGRLLCANEFLESEKVAVTLLKNLSVNGKESDNIIIEENGVKE